MQNAPPEETIANKKWVGTKVSAEHVIGSSRIKLAISIASSARQKNSEVVVASLLSGPTIRGPIQPDRMSFPLRALKREETF